MWSALGNAETWSDYQFPKDSAGYIQQILLAAILDFH